MLARMSRLVCLLPLFAGALVYAVLGHPFLPIVEFELAWTSDRAMDLVAGRTSEFRDALVADWAAFIPGYVLTIVLCVRRQASRRAALLVSLLAIDAGVCDVVENWWLWRGLSDPTDHNFMLATVFACAKFVLLVPAAVFAVRALVRPTAREQVAAVG
jgi:hypothetical protein